VPPTPVVQAPPAAEAPAPPPAHAPAPPPAAAKPAEAPVVPAPAIAPPPAAAVGEPAPPAQEPAPVLPEGPTSVALLLPLSGPSAALGRAMFDAAQMALFDVGAEKLVLLPYDTAGTPEGAARAVASAVADGAALVLGPVFAASVEAVAPVARTAGVSVLAFSSDRRAAAPGVYVLGFLPEAQAARIVAYAATRGARRLAALAPANGYGQRVVREAREAAKRAGAALVDVVYYPTELAAASDAAEIVRVFTNYDARRSALAAQRRTLAARKDEVSREALRRLEGRETLGEVPFDAVLMPDGGDRLTMVAPLLPFYDVDMRKVRLLGTAQWRTAALATEPTLEGGWFAAPPRRALSAFEARFAERFGKKPPELAALAYDTVALAGALARLPDGPDYGAKTLTNAGGFRGLSGIFRLRADGISERGLAIYEVRDGKPVVIDPAPESFAGF